MQIHGTFHGLKITDWYEESHQSCPLYTLNSLLGFPYISYFINTLSTMGNSFMVFGKKTRKLFLKKPMFNNMEGSETLLGTKPNTFNII